MNCNLEKYHELWQGLIVCILLCPTGGCSDDTIIPKGVGTMLTSHGITHSRLEQADLSIAVAANPEITYSNENPTNVDWEAFEFEDIDSTEGAAVLSNLSELRLGSMCACEFQFEVAMRIEVDSREYYIVGHSRHASHGHVVLLQGNRIVAGMAIPNDSFEMLRRLHLKGDHDIRGKEDAEGEE